MASHFTEAKVVVTTVELELFAVGSVPLFHHHHTMCNLASA